MVGGMRGAGVASQDCSAVGPVSCGRAACTHVGQLQTAWRMLSSGSPDAEVAAVNSLELIDPGVSPSPSAALQYFVQVWKLLGRGFLAFIRCPEKPVSGGVYDTAVQSGSECELHCAALVFTPEWALQLGKVKMYMVLSWFVSRVQFQVRSLKHDSGL